MPPRNRRHEKKKGPGPSKLSLPPLTASDLDKLKVVDVLDMPLPPDLLEILSPPAPPPNPKGDKETEIVPAPSEDLWDGLGGSDQLEAMLLSKAGKVGKEDTARRSPPRERLMPLQQKIELWNNYLLSLSIHEIMTKFGHSPVPERTMTRFQLDDLERLRKDMPQGCAELGIFFSPEELAEIEVGVVPTSREDEWDAYLEELEIEAAAEAEENGGGEMKDGTIEKVDS